MTDRLAALSAEQRRDLKWLKNAEHWGEWIRFSETKAAPPERVWMMRAAGGSVRFYAKGKGQVGPQHSSVVAATTWAWANRWLWLEEDGTLDILNQLTCRKWVLAGGAEKNITGVQHLDAPDRKTQTTTNAPPEQHPVGSVA